MPTLELMRPDHADALPAFERENRQYFARSVPDCGDAYFAELTAVTTLDNPASRAVLRRNGFVPVADLRIDGRPGQRFRRLLDSGT